MDAFSLTVANLRDVFLFLSPGFIFILLFFYQIPGKSKDSLTIIFFSVLLSLIIDSFSIEVLKIISVLFHIPIQVNEFWLAIALSILLAIGIAKIVQTHFFKKLSKILFHVNAEPFGRVWNDFFNVQTITVLRVFLSDGTCYIGKLDRASMDPDDIQEITLLDPYYFELIRGRPTVTRVKETTSVLLQSNAIKSVEKIASDEAKKLYELPT